jgi:hypothetical protein
MRAAAASLALFAACAATAASASDDAPDPAAIRDAARGVLARPEFRYADPKAKGFIEELWDGWVALLLEFREQYPWLFVAAVAALTVLLLLLVAHIVWTLRSARDSAWELELDADLGSALRRGDPAPFRARALAHAHAGRFDEAVRDLYAALLLTLDRNGTVSYASHKALVDYRIEARADARAGAALDLFAGTYHPGSFGRRPPDRAHFDGLLAALEGCAESRP